MPGAPTPRFGLELPLGSDGPPDVPARVEQPFGQIERFAAMQDRGATRPAAGAGNKGMFWESPARGTLDFSTGTRWLSLKVQPEVVSSLPAAADSYVDQELLLQPQSSQSIYWHLRRVGDFWVPVGQQVPTWSAVSLMIGTSTWSISGPTLSVPAAGTYDVEVSGFPSPHGGADGGQITALQGTSEMVSAWVRGMMDGDFSDEITLSRRLRVPLVAGALNLRAKRRGSSGEVYVGSAMMWLSPAWIPVS